MKSEQNEEWTSLFHFRHWFLFQEIISISTSILNFRMSLIFLLAKIKELKKSKNWKIVLCRRWTLLFVPFVSKLYLGKCFHTCSWHIQDLIKSCYRECKYEIEIAKPSFLQARLVKDQARLARYLKKFRLIICYNQKLSKSSLHMWIINK